MYAPPYPVPPETLLLTSVTIGAILSTVAFVPAAAVVLPVALVTITLTLRLMASMEPAVSVWVAVHVSPLLNAETAAPPPNAEKSTVTPLMPLLLSPPAVLSQVAVIVSPILNVQPVPVAPAIEMLASVTIGSALLTVMPLPVLSATSTPEFAPAAQSSAAARLYVVPSREEVPFLFRKAFTPDRSMGLNVNVKLWHEVISTLGVLVKR